MLDSLSVTEIARRCREETERYLRGELAMDQFCMELFRRALVLHDEVAWAYLYQQYADMVRHWLGARHDAALDGEVSVVFTRFWRASRNHSRSLRRNYLSLSPGHLRRRRTSSAGSR